MSGPKDIAHEVQNAVVGCDVRLNHFSTSHANEFIGNFNQNRVTRKGH